MRHRLGMSSLQPSTAAPARARVYRQDGPTVAWEIALRPPAPPLRPYCREYTGYRERCAGPSLRREIGAARVVFIIELGTPVRVSGPRRGGVRSFPGGFVAGLHDGFAQVAHDGEQSGVQIDLSPVGARLLFGVPLNELTGDVVSLLDLVPDLRDLADRMRDVPSWDARFDLLDRELCRRLLRPTPHGRAVDAAVSAIERAGGLIEVGAVARALGYSERHVGRLFREHVGVAPKRFARLVRLQRLIDAISGAPPSSWAELAVDLGFYDQSHLAREVRDLAGMTPTELLAERGDMPEALAG